MAGSGYIFFLISGFVICMSCWGKPLGDFFVSRVVRLYPAYWFGSAGHYGDPGGVPEGKPSAAVDMPE
uniref:Integral membrane protein n=1 Tax=Streptomyces sp. NBC_00003 TaxID=2903608 RepID=A0AAU2VA93_9ACTN